MPFGMDRSRYLAALAEIEKSAGKKEGPKLCVVPGCPRYAKSHEMCQCHIYRMQVYGETELPMRHCPVCGCEVGRRKYDCKCGPCLQNHKRAKQRGRYKARHAFI